LLDNSTVGGRPLLATERHFSPTELAEIWNFSPAKIRDIFADEPGVLKVGEPSRRVGRILKRRYTTLRIPQSVAVRVHARLSQAVAA
jgi:hypothetical protein